MATQTPPSGSIELAGLTRTEFIVLAHAAVAKLKWHGPSVHPKRLEAYKPWSAWSYGEDIVIDIGDDRAVITSAHERWSFGAKRRDARNVQRFIEAFALVRQEMTPDRMRAEVDELEASGAMEQDDSALIEEESSWTDGFRLFFVPRPGFFMTPLLMYTSLLVYVVMVASGAHFMEPTGEDLLAWGANYRPVTIAGEWWRLLMCCFEHMGILHLVMNMFALLMIGLDLEPYLGKWRMLLAYVTTGIAASTASLWWHPNTVSAGASGAIFGLYGVFFALLFTDLIPKEARKSLLMSIGIFILYNLANGMKGGIDNAAHIGGLASGFVLGFAIYASLKHPEKHWLTVGSFLLPSVIFAATGWMAVRGLPQDDATFSRTIDDFQRLERTGLLAFNLPDGATAVEQLILVQDSCLPALKVAVHLMHTTRDLDLSDQMTTQRELFIAYAEARERNMELLEEGLLRGDEMMRPELEASFARVDSILAIINGE